MGGMAAGEWCTGGQAARRTFRWCRDLERDPGIADAFAALSGNATVAQTAAQILMAERTLRRRFTAATGVTLVHARAGAAPSPVCPHGAPHRDGGGGGSRRLYRPAARRTGRPRAHWPPADRASPAVGRSPVPDGFGWPNSPGPTGATAWSLDDLPIDAHRRVVQAYQPSPASGQPLSGICTPDATHLPVVRRSTDERQHRRRVCQG